MEEKLKQAQELLSEVYDEAGKSGNVEVERLMSVADSCIIDALDIIAGSP